MPNNIGIYRFYNIKNGKSYIGRSNNLRHRYTEHINLLRKGKEPCVKLNRAWLKHGEDCFEYEIVCLCNEDELNEMEIKYIEKYNSFKKGYNCTKGGDGISGYKHTERAKIKIGEASRGHKVNPETKIKMSEWQRGKRLSENHKEALCHAWTDERKNSMSLSRSGTLNPNYGRTGKDACNSSPVVCSSGEFFFTLKEAAEWCGLSSTGNISSCCKGTRRFAGLHPKTKERLSWRKATPQEIALHIS